MIRRWYYIPALLFLLLTLASGIWLRLQWSWPQWMMFRADYLTHGHSHAALLGWGFLAMMGLVLEAGTRPMRLPRYLVVGLGMLTAAVTLFLFVVFVSGGYTPFSILLSTIHMFLGYGLAWIFFRNARNDENIGARNFLEGAVFWMVTATAGTWMLAAGRSLPSFWMDASVQFYLHVLFNGWFLFALCGLAYRYLIPAGYHDKVWPFWMMMAGLLPSLIPQLSLEEPSLLMISVGLAGTVLFAGGGLAVIGLTIRSLTGNRTRHINSGHYSAPQVRWISMELLWMGLIGGALILLLPVPMAWPSFREIWLQSDFLVIGFIHLHLLVVVSTLLLFAILQRFVSRQKLKRPSALVRAGTLIYICGTVAMVFLLFLTGILQVTAVNPFYSVQKMLFYSGVVTLTGLVILFVPVIRNGLRGPLRQAERQSSG